MRATRVLALVLLLSACVAPALRGDFTQQPDETLPGFKSQQVYDFNGVDNVNLFSGEMHLAVPLGPEYPLSSGLKWRLRAHYSSKLWHMWLAECRGTSACPGKPETAHRAQVAGTSTLGVGWILELGSVRPPVGGEGASYKAPDGSTHFGQLTANPDPNANLRLDPRRADGTYVVRQADGTALYFEHLYSIPTPANGFDFNDEDRYPATAIQTARYGLSRIVDRFGRTVLQVSYLANCAGTPCPTNAWKVSTIQLGSLSRKVTFNWRTYAGSGTFDVLDSVQFPLSDGVAPGDSLTAAFSYFPSGVLYRTFDFGGSQTYCPESGPGSTNVPFLAAIAQGPQTFSFRYESPGRGLLVGMTLPTGGAVSYVYQGYTVGTPGVCDLNCASPEIAPGGCAVGGVLQAAPPFATLTDPNNCDDMSYYMQFTDGSPAVVTRTETGLPNELPGGAAVVSITNYERDEVGSPLNPGFNELDPQRVVRRVLVHRTDGNGSALTDKYVFSAGVGVQQGAELSHRTYTNCNGAEPPVRSTVQCFRRPDSNVCGVMETAKLINNLYIVDLLPSRRETWYGKNPIPDASGCPSDPAVKCWQDDFTGYDPAALEYTTVMRSSPSDVLVSSPGAVRTTTTTWTPTAPGAVPWLPKLSSAKTVTDAPCLNAPCSVTTNTIVDAANGFLRSSSTTDAATGTLTQSFTRDPATGDPLTETLSATFDATSYTNTRTYQAGLATSVKRTAPAGIGWLSFDVDRNPYTGRITASRDPNGLATAYGYDGLERLTSVSPPDGETPTTYCYFDWSASGEMSAVFAKRGGAACGPDDSVPGAGSGPFEAYQYDGIGRVKREIRRLPNPLEGGGYFAFRELRYNAAGLKSFESEWSPCGASPSPTSARSCYASFATNGTTYSNFDFLGRPRTIRLADGATITKSFDDPAGIPDSDFTELVSRSVSGVTVNSASRKDVLGRLLIAAEPAPAPAPFGRYTVYYYNVLDRIAAMTLPMGTGDPAHDPPAPPQNRAFTYDALGLLRSESHPEKGVTSYSAYNALGEVKAKTEGGNAYAYTYDALGRMTATSANGMPYLTNLYDLDIFGGVIANRPLGKVVQQNAYHPLSDQNVWVAHNLGYGGLGGRLSIDDHWAILGGSVLFHAPTSYSWNGLGLLGTHNHARSSGAWNAATTYVSGLPASITADGKPFVTGATYNPWGGLLSYRTANGVTTSIEADPSLMPRPLRITTAGADVNFTTGFYGYDGSGNNLSINGDLFRYDARGHLTRANYFFPGAPFDAYEYDAYGNQFKRTWEAGSQDLTTDPATNRLTGSSYDLLGNLTLNGSDQHTYDALSRQTRYVGPGANERYYYDAGGERLARVVFASSLPKQSVQESFFNLTPCRLLDTRFPNGALGAPSIPGQGSRSFAVAGVCGIPSNAKALALNVTSVPNPTSAASGNVRLYPTGLSYQPLGTANAYRAGTARANQFFGSIDGPTAGSFTLFNEAPAGTSVDVVVDVQGYFAPGASAPPQTGDSWFLTVRDLDKRPSTEFRYDTATGQTAVLKDYVYLGNQLVGTYTTTGVPNGTVFYTNDHLGSPRFLTAGASPTKLAEYRYRAFGLALTSPIPGQGPEFASMERDLASSDLYDHARYVGGKLGRFKSADQLGGRPEDPQSWNRYAYARNNPVRMVDRDGRSSADAIAEARVRRDIQQRDGAAGVAAYDRGADTGAALTLGTLAIAGGGAFVSSFLATQPALAVWIGSVGLGMVGGPTPQQALQGVATRVSEDLAANPALARTVLSQAEYAAGRESASVARMGFGKAVERLMTREVVTDPSLNAMYRHVGGPSRPDFVGRIGSEAVGMRFEVTTTAGVAAHQSRPYGAGLQFVVYERPEAFRLFP